MADPDRIGKEQTVTLTLTVISNQERKDGLEGVFSYLGIPCAVTTACHRTGRRAGQGTVARLLGSGPLSHGRARALTKSPTAAPAWHLQSAIMDGYCSFHGWTVSDARIEEKGWEIDRLAGWRLAAEAAVPPPRSCRQPPPPFFSSAAATPFGGERGKEEENGLGFGEGRPAGGVLIPRKSRMAVRSN